MVSRKIVRVIPLHQGQPDPSPCDVLLECGHYKTCAIGLYTPGEETPCKFCDKLAELQERFDNLANSGEVLSRAEVLSYTPTRELTDVEAEASGLCRKCHTKRECETVEATYKRQFSTKDPIRLPVLLCKECLDKVGYGPSGVK